MTCQQRLPLFATKLVIAIKQKKNKKFINDEGGQNHLPIMARSLQFADRLLLVVPAANTNKKAAQTTHPWVRIRWRKKWDVRITTFLWKHCIKQYINFLLNTVKFCMAKTQWPKVFMFPSFACRSLIVRLSIYHFTNSRFSGCTNINPNKYMEMLITASIARSKEIIFFCPLVSAFA